MRYPVRVNCITSALLLSLLSAPARAGVPIALPTTEQLTAWDDAFEIAGLEEAHGNPSITVEVVGSWWKVRVTAPGGGVRTARIPAPLTAADREDTALLAIGLARELGLAKAPRPRRLTVPPPPPPPPPPEPIVAPSTESPTEEPPPEEPEPFIVEPLPRFLIDSPGPIPPPIYPRRRAQWRATPVNESPLLSSERVEPRRRRFGQISTPAIHMGLNVSLLRDADPTLGIVLGARFVQFQHIFGGIDILADVGRTLHLGAVPDRVLQTNRVHASLGIDWLQRVHFLGHFGLTYLAFRQQYSAIDQWFTPHIGVSAELDLIKFKGFTVAGLRVSGLADLGVLQLRDEFNKIHSFSPLEASLSFLFKIPPLGDPSITMATSTQ